MSTKKILSILIVFSIIICCFTACGNDDKGNGGNPLKASTATADEINKTEPQIVLLDDTFKDSQLNFNIDMIKKIAAKEQDKNVVISPLSVGIAITMANNGAKGNTQSEIQSTINGGLPIEFTNNYFYSYLSSLPNSGANKVSIANSIWANKEYNNKIKDGFLKTLNDYYKAEAYNETFNEETKNNINNWVKKNTKNMIEKIIDKINPEATMYLINVISFDSKWEKQYENSDINKNGLFTNSLGEEKKATMMNSTEQEYIETDRAIGFVKPYKNSEYEFVAVLPNEGTDIYAYINSLDIEELKNILNNRTQTKVVATTPKFEYSYNINLNDTLKEMGIVDAFSIDSADFSGMYENKQGNHIDSVLHKAFISLDPEGTKASAATAISMTENAVLEEPPKIVSLERPFLYLIVDSKNKIPIFIGVVSDI